MFLLSNAFLNFLQEYLTYIVLGVSVLVLLIIAIIIAVTVKRSKKPFTYVSDEIDRTVDQAAKQKAALSAQAKDRHNEHAEKTSIQKASAITSAQAPIIQAEQTDELTTAAEAAPREHAQTDELTTAAEAAPREHAQTDEPTTAAEAAPREHTQTDEPTTAAEAAPREHAQTDELTTAAEATPRKHAQTDDSGEHTNLEETLAKTDENQLNGDAVLQQKSRPVSYRVVYDSETRTWEVRKDNAKRVIRRVHTKKEALQIAHELSQNQELNLVVHKKDGKFQKRR